VHCGPNGVKWNSGPLQKREYRGRWNPKISAEVPGTRRQQSVEWHCVRGEIGLF
jgi:hypothetical protein